MAENAISLKLTLAGLANVEAGLKRLSSEIGHQKAQMDALKGGTTGLASAFTNFKASTAALAAGAVGAAAAIGLIVKTGAHLTKEAINNADELGKMAQKTGIAVEELSGLAYAAELSDASLDDLRVGIKNLSDEMVKTGKGSGDLSVDLLRAADELTHISDEAKRSVRANELFGRSSQNLIPLLLQGSAAIRAQIAEAKEFGVVVGANFSKNAEEFNDNLTRIKNAFKGLTYQVAEEALPRLLDLTNWFIAFIRDNRAKAIDLASFSFRALSESIELVKTGYSGLTDAIVSFNTELLKTGSILKAITSANNAFAAAGVGALIKPFQQMADSALAGLSALTQQNKALNEYVALATRAESVKAMLEQGRRNILNDASPVNFPDRESRVRRAEHDLRQQIDLINLAKKDLGPAPPTEANFDANGRLVMTQRQIEFQAKMGPLLREEIELREKLQKLAEENTFTGAMAANLRELSDAWSNFGKNMADALTNGLGGAIDALSAGIAGLVDGTTNWGQTFLNVGKQIIASIARIVIQWVVSMTVMKALKSAFAVSDKAEAGLATAAWAVPAYYSSVASYGSAAYIGAMALNAGLISSLALAAGMIPFMDGGFTGVGERTSVAGLVHRGEFVMPAAAVARIGIPQLEALRHGYEPETGGAHGSAMMGSAPVFKPNFSFAMVNSRAELREFMESADGEKLVWNIMLRRRTDLGLNT